MDASLIEKIQITLENALIKKVFTTKCLMKLAVRRIEKVTGHKMSDEERDKTVEDLMSSYKEVAE